MTICRFMKACRGLLKAGWQARINPETGRGIQLKKPGGRTFCFDLFTAVYSEQRGKLCRDRLTARNNIDIQKCDGVYQEDVSAASNGCSSDEGMEKTCRELYHQMLYELELPIPQKKATTKVIVTDQAYEWWGPLKDMMERHRLWFALPGRRKNVVCVDPTDKADPPTTLCLWTGTKAIHRPEFPKGTRIVVED